MQLEGSGFGYLVNFFSGLLALFQCVSLVIFGDLFFIWLLVFFRLSWSFEALDIFLPSYLSIEVYFWFKKFADRDISFNF